MLALCTGFVHSQIVYACVRDGLLLRLAAGAVSIDALARDQAVDASRLRRLLRAAEALGLVEFIGDDACMLGEYGALIDGNRGLQQLIRHHPPFYADLADPSRLLDTDHAAELQRFWSYAGAGATAASGSDVAPYTDVMAASQDAIAELVVDRVDLGRCKRLLDIGGGDGSFAIALATAWPQLRLVVADLPAVVQIAAARIASAGMSERIAVAGVDFFVDPLPGDADTVSLVRILHDHDDAAAGALLSAARAALRPGGRLLIVEPLAERGAAGRTAAGLFWRLFSRHGAGPAAHAGRADGAARGRGIRPDPPDSSAAAGRRQHRHGDGSAQECKFELTRTIVRVN